MNRLTLFLQGLVRRNGTKPYPRLMTHVVLGYSSLEESIDLVCAMEEGGAALVELQIPFSDPMADGPTIMRANQQALAAGVTPDDCMEAMALLGRKTSLPLLFMSYFNLPFNYRARAGSSGLARFIDDAKKAGASGLIVPDVPLEENSEGYWTRSRAAGLLPIPLVTPVTRPERLRKIAAAVPEGFVYCVSTTGTTGARSALPEGLGAYLQSVKRTFALPRAVGFGISQPQHVRALRGIAEIAIVGSAMIDLVDRTSRAKRAAAVRQFTKELSRQG